MNRINELQNDDKTTSKDPSRRSKTLPRPSKEGTRAPKSGPRPLPRRPKIPPGALLERSWSHLGTNRSQDRKKVAPRRFGLNSRKLFGSILEPKTTPKTTPRRSQNESKIKTKNASLFYRSWTRLGPVLRRSWAHLGGIFGHFALVFPMFFENRHFRTNDGSRCVFGPT